ncbi:VCBS repeat-containing protein [Candidatus Woesearchaeota archaeon]|nr:VCBS repeat-containing protein [Candidatus Woesearchaeota archaeon]
MGKISIFLIVILCATTVYAADTYKPYLHNAAVPGHPEIKLFGTYQTNLFPGAATYSVPIAVSPGTHGLQPMLEISYNSQNTHHGILGIGWTLTQNYILRVGNGTNTTPDDTYRLVLNGNAYNLVYGAEGQWHTEVDQHFKIENLSGAHSYWQVIRADGMKYRFGFTDDAELPSQNTNRTIQWSLDTVTDTFGNTLAYTYRENPFSDDNSSVYLEEINYGTRKITFTYENTTRPDRSLTIVEGNVVEESRRLADVYNFADNNLVNRYALRYSQLTPVVSSLESIVMYGADNSSVLTFSFDYFTPEKGHGRNTTQWDPPVYFSESVGGADYGVRLLDFNNDGLIDIVKGRQSSAEKLAWRNDRQSGWVQDAQWSPPIYFVTTTGVDRGINFADVNNDGYTDILEAYDGTRHVYLNNKSGWNDSNWVLPSDFIATRDRGMRVDDINGDGYPDLVRSDGHDGTKKVYINNRSGWTDKSSEWEIPEYFTGENGVDFGSRLIDINGDGMADIIRGWSTAGQPIERSAWVSTGSKWINMSLRWKPPLDFKIAAGDAGVRLYDANGDGLIDIIHNSGSNESAWLNNGTGWLRNDSWVSPIAFVDSGLNIGVRILDANGDGFVDILSARESTGEKYTYIRNSTLPPLLRRITNIYGGVMNISYVSSTRFNNSERGNFTLGFSMFVVSNVTTNNSVAYGLGVVGSTSYNYSFGVFNNEKKEFRGFGRVEERTPSGVLRHYFHQDTAMQGREYLTEVLEGRMIEATARGYDFKENNGIFNLSPAFVSHYQHDGNETARVINTTFVYDNFGNLITQIEYGDVNISDERTTVNVFAVNKDNWIVDRLAQTLTKKEEWNNNGNNTFAYFEYDDFGNVVKVTDTLGNSMSMFYDGTHTFPITMVNALGHVMTMTYDAGTGNKLTETKNDITTTFVYDAFGRILKEVMPLDTVYQPTKTYDYSFDGIAPEQVVVKLKTTANNTDVVRYYYDGFGNLIQLKKDIENNRQVVQNFVYDSQNRVVSVQNPHFVSFSSGLSAVSTDAATNYSYDALDRVISVRNADGTTKNVTFDRWNISDYNENGVKHVYMLDGYDRIVRVFEFNNDTITGDNETYTTAYEYDGNDNLVKIIDTQGNVFSFTYDSLGRKIAMDDPDLGHWTYRYDANGNLILQAGSNGALITGDGYFREYNDFGQQIRIRNGSTITSALLEEYFYDHDGQRIKIKRNDSSNTTVYTPYREIQRIVNVTGTYDFYYVYHEGQLISRKNPDGTIVYFHADHLGSAQVITNGSGTVIQNTTYSPYGEEVIGGTADERGYTGQFDDALTEQMYYGARYYLPELGLWTSSDPIIQNIYDPQFLNHYVYVRANPYRLIDPTGKDARVYLNREAANIFKSGSLAGPWGHYAVAIDDPTNHGKEIVFENQGVDLPLQNAQRNHFSKDVRDEAGNIILPETYDEYVELEQNTLTDIKMIKEGLRLEKGRWTYLMQVHDSESYALKILKSGGYKVSRNYWSPTKTYDNEIKELTQENTKSRNLRNPFNQNVCKTFQNCFKPLKGNDPTKNEREVE